MPKFLVECSYSAEGLRGLVKDNASGRQAVAKEALASLNGKLEVMYFQLCDADAYVLCECPDRVSAAALSVAVPASGLARTKVIPLMTVEETDRALSMKSVCRAPGGSKAAKA